MAISPPSDIVMDVVRAAEPDAVATARAGLEKASRSAGVPAFSMAEGAGLASSTPARTASVDDPKKKPFVEFEAMVLQTFLQSMLPSDSESVYGSGLSGDMWKSLLAQEMGKAMAQTGGIGIADKVAADFYREGERVVPVAGVDRDPATPENDRQDMLATALVQELQRLTSRHIGAGQLDENQRGGI